MKKIIVGLVALLSMSAAVAQEDAEGCKDHPLFTRMPNMYIYECSHNYDAADIRMGQEETKTLEGTKTRVHYMFNAETGTQGPSFLQIVKNYENALKPHNGKRVFYSRDEIVATFFLRSGGKDVWLSMQGNDYREAEYILTILEMEEMKQEITANVLLDELNAKGSVALYINFETGKSAIKPESQSIVDEIAKMLKENNTLKVSIEGHTDNVGAAEANKKLSNDRAAAVLSAISAAGIEKLRLQAKGWGQEKPVADNETEEGRAKNRRVEIVKVQ